jgi:signal transduction histidine kinase
MTSSAAGASRKKTAEEKAADRSPLAQLLHALNQPLTGLQCSMEVALACPRTVEQYVQGLRQGLELTERMRALVEAMREVADIEEEEQQAPQTEMPELAAVLREVVDELRPVAEMKNVRIAADFSSASSAQVTGQRPTGPGSPRPGPAGQGSALARVIFRLLDATLSMAAPGTDLRMETGSETSQLWVRIQWQAAAPRSEYSRPELGLLISQAWMKRAGAEWERERAGELETLSIRRPRVS